MLITASIPSGIMTMSEVPTRMPTPRLEMKRSCDGDRVIDNGSPPARKELRIVSDRILFGPAQRLDLRECHDQLFTWSVFNIVAQLIE